MASDGSSSAVRAASLDAITDLLEAKHSHGVLRGLLPCLGNLIHDKAERVRLAACRMLIRIKKTPGIKFYHVVPVDQVKARLIEESRLHNNPRSNVARELSSLLLNSYFPQGKNASAPMQVQRTMAFLLTDSGAASVFYSNLSDLLDVESVAKFVSMLLACLKTAVEKDQTQELKDSQATKKRRRPAGDDESKDSQQKQSLTASNLPLMANLAETIAILLESIAPSLSEDKYKECQERVLLRLVDSQVVNILTHFEQKGLDTGTSNSQGSLAREDCFRACSGILRCVKVFPRENVDEDIISFISSSLDTIPKSCKLSTQFISSHLSFLCAWGMTEDVALALARSIEKAFGRDRLSLLSPDFAMEGDRKRSRRSSVDKDKRKVTIPTYDPLILRPIVDGILTGSSPSTKELRAFIIDSPEAMKVIETALSDGPIFAERLLVADSVSRTIFLSIILLFMNSQYVFVCK